MSDDYSNHPKSISEIKGEKSENAFNWTPRDALISVLRKLDAGEVQNVDAIFIAYRQNKGSGTTSTHFSNAGPDIQVTMGLIECAKQLLWRDGE